MKPRANQIAPISREALYVHLLRETERDGKRGRNRRRKTPISSKAQNAYLFLKPRAKQGTPISGEAQYVHLLRGTKGQGKSERNRRRKRRRVRESEREKECIGKEREGMYEGGRTREGKRKGGGQR